MPHIHVGIADGIKVFALVLLFGTLWHVLAMMLAPMDGPLGNVGKAMAFMY